VTTPPIRQPEPPGNRGPWRELFAYDGEEWRPADGTPALAFGGNADGWPYAIYYEGPRGARDERIARAALDFVRNRYSVANGCAVNREGRYYR
jgi:hypothetical protein